VRPVLLQLAESSKQTEAAQLLESYVAMPPTLAQQAVLNTARGLRDEGGGSRRGGSGSGSSAGGAGAGNPLDRKVKLMLLGDPSTGKSQILTAYARANAKLRQTAAPDGDERGLQLEGELTLDGRSVAVELVDAPLADAARASLMPLTTLFLVFFSVIDPDSYANALKKVPYFFVWPCVAILCRC
jgi:hypothetical protein